MKKINLIILLIFFTLFSLFVTAKSDSTRKLEYYSNALFSNFEFENIRDFFSFNTLEDVPCIAPDSKVVVENITKNSATFKWEDDVNGEWEYYVQLAGVSALPSGSGNLTKVKTHTAIQLSGSKTPLIPNTEYEFFVRAKCSGLDYSQWVGPILFRTLCDVQTIPFKESFELSSVTLNCWQIIDNNKDETTSKSNIWKQSTTKYEGKHSMAFTGDNKTTHDDWLISPTFTLEDTKYYRITYQYRTNTTSKNSFEVLLSSSGDKVDDFKKVLLKKTDESNSSWVEEKIIVGNIKGDVNLAWRFISGNNLFVDNINIEEFVGCAEPMALGVKNVGQNDATIYWSDDLGVEWEYVVQNAGSSISKSTVGVTTSLKDVNVTKDNSGNNIKSSTFYEFYVRSKCTDGSLSMWSGPYKFKTLCGINETPFWEGFNNDSGSWSCWTVYDGNGDGYEGSFEDKWFRVPATNYGGDKYEGDSSVKFKRFEESYNTDDDWLISPPIKFEANKTYRLKYHYRIGVGTEGQSDFQVLLSDSGIDKKSFTNVIVASKKYSNTNWLGEHVFIKGYSGTVNLAWLISGKNDKEIFIDNVFVEEVLGCEEPIKLAADDVLSKEAVISWEDKSGATKWEYFVQPTGAGVPTTSGIETSKTDNKILKDNKGDNLKPNTDYEFYVRSKCTPTGFSIWSGPFVFTTVCDIYEAPFWEGFNTGELGIRCWTVIDSKGNQVPPGGKWKQIKIPYEGDAGMGFSTYGVSNDWLISPGIKLDGGDYVLKYHYKTTNDLGGNQKNEFEVLLSKNGIDTKDFTTVLVPSKIYKVGNYVEEVVFLSGINGNVNLSWHVTSKSNESHVYIDNVILKKVETCPEPFYLKSDNVTSNSVDVDWNQNGGVTSWEVILVDYKETAGSTPISTKIVTTDPKTTISGLEAGRGYTLYVRAVCEDGKSYSDWGTGINVITKIGPNDFCTGALNLPVNPTLDCVDKLSVTNIGASLSDKDSNTTSCLYFNVVNDLWFEFTATSTMHILQANNVEVTSGIGGDIYALLYDKDCSQNLGTTAIPSHCGRLLGLENYEFVYRNLVVGQKYYLKLGFKSGDSYLFDLCLTTPTPLEVSASGTEYTVDELIKDVFVTSSCDLVSNVHYQNGNGGVVAQKYNTFGAFEKGDSSFPFEKGIVLSTNEIDYVAGPWRGNNNPPRGDNNERWIGDKDINDAINSAGGGPYSTKRVTQVEFEFVPLKDSIQFEYLFASNSYHKNCIVACDVAALFAAWLIDTTTDEGENLAKVPGTNLPISINTIRNANMSGTECGNENAEYYWKHYDGVDKPAESPIDFVGYTVPMKSAMTAVIPGRTYRIKLAVMDFCTTPEHSSAVFFNAGSFDLGTLDLGEDLLIETGNALCDGEAVEIKTDIALSDEIRAEIQWFQDGIALGGETGPNLNVTHTGDYKVVVKYPDLGCESVGEVRVEMFPPISLVVSAPKNIAVCRNSTDAQIVDLSSVEEEMFKKVDRNHYKTLYYNSEVEAIEAVNPIESSYELSEFGVSRKFYIRVEDTRSGCFEVFELSLNPESGEIPVKPEDVFVCASYTLPELADNQYYFSGSEATGIEFKAGDVLDVSGEHTMFVLQRNGEEGCYEEVSFKVTITEPIVADVFKDRVLRCELYKLNELSPNNSYHTEPNGKGDKLLEGTYLQSGGTFYVYASSEDGLCVDESSFTIEYEECPIQKGISPNGDGINDVFDLSAHGVYSLKIFNRYGSEVYSYGVGYTNEWKGQDKGGNLLPDGTYYYVIIARGETRSGWVQINK
ncbi:choice-of-anchor J domain-containing protein [Myroides guanonis]|uniref:Cleaved Adhesin Domain n=1 Tax=Myroides guanonis TaxID=1150112 RepID=A0A1I3SGJ3_9FLAO|nr:choice-of-anchor J domain-containing protein [Myroides guanonis]SFJ57858.1 Cleaved Adhesin Domain [Myroides guanonis]